MALEGKTADIKHQPSHCIRDAHHLHDLPWLGLSSVTGLRGVAHVSAEERDSPRLPLQKERTMCSLHVGYKVMLHLLEEAACT